jgi:hypothetical protein
VYIPVWSPVKTRLALPPDPSYNMLLVGLAPMVQEQPVQLSAGCQRYWPPTRLATCGSMHRHEEVVILLAKYGAFLLHVRLIGERGCLLGVHECGIGPRSPNVCSRAAVRRKADT